MSLTLVTGPANAAKAGAVLDGFRAALGRGPFLVVPTRADVVHYERELAGPGTLVGGRVTSFSGLVREVARRTRIQAAAAGAVLRERAMAAAAARVSSGALGPVDAPGFRAAALALAAELGRERVTPARLAQALGAWASGDPEREPYAEALGRLYGSYHRALDDAGRVDDAWLGWRALEGLRRAPASWGTSAVFLYGFDDLDPVQRALVVALGRDAGAEVTVSLPYEPRRAFAGRLRTLAELKPDADRLIELPARVLFYAPQSAEALHRLERGLFEDPEDTPPPVPTGDAVLLLEAGGNRAEAELVAAEVAGALADGIAPGEIAVVARSPRDAAPLLARVFASYGVPLGVAAEVPAGRTRLGRAVVAGLRCAVAPDASAEDLLTWLAPWVRARGRLDELEARCRREGLQDAGAARAAWEGAGGLELSELDRLAAAGARGAGAFLAATRTELRRLASRPHTGEAPVWGPGEDGEIRVLAALLRHVDALRALPPVLQPDPDELAGALADLRVAPAPVGDDVVLLSDPLGIRARRFRVVVVCGLQDGEFPRPPRPEPFLADAVRRELAEVAGLRLEREEELAEEERYLLYACVSRATDRLVLSHRTSDEEGDPAVPSAFLRELRRLLPDLPVRRRGLADVVWDASAAPTERERARARAAAEPVGPPVGLGDVTVADLRRRLRHNDVLSAGALEAYAACPVRWLVERELEPEGIEPDADALARGSYAHAVLERTLAGLRERTGSAKVVTGNASIAREELAAALEAHRPLLAERLSATVARAVVQEVEAAAVRLLARFEREAVHDFTPEHLEWRFGMGPDGPPPLELREGTEAVRVRGAVDRVDVDPAGRALIRDYKSGRVGPERSSVQWLDRGDLQVGIYLLAVQKLLGLEPAGGLYQPLRGAGGDARARGALLDLPELAALANGGGCWFGSDVQSAEELAALLGAIEARVVELGRKLRSGDLTPSPTTCGWDGTCKYPGICRRSG